MAVFRALWRLYKALSLGIPIVVFALTALAGFWSPRLATVAWWMGGAAGALTLLVLLRYALRPTSDTYGSAAFASLRDLWRNSLFGSQGLILGKRLGHTLRFNRDGHLLTFAPTRTGKGVGCVIPNLLDHSGSVVVTDIKGENITITGRWRASLGPVHAMAPFNRDIGGSRYNPVDFIRTGQPEDVDDAALIADLLVVPHGLKTFWDSEAESLIAALLLLVAYDRPPELRTIHHLWELLMQGRDGFAALIEEMRVSPHAAVRRAGEGFSQKEERERSAVISTAQTHLKIWKSPLLAEATQSSDFQLEDLKRSVMSLYIVIPPELLAVYQPFVRLMVGLSVSAMTRVPGRPKERVLFLLDEIAALGRMAPVETAIAYLAGYGVSLWLFFQDLDQLQKTYPKWRSIIANCNVRQAFGVADYETAKELSSMMGNRTLRAASQGQSGDWLMPLPEHSHNSTSETGRALMTPDEITVMPQHLQLIFVQACRPILATKVRYYDEWRFRGRFESWLP